MKKNKTWIIIIFGALAGVAISQALKASGWITESNRFLVFVIIIGTIGLFVFIFSAVKAYKGENEKTDK